MRIVGGDLRGRKLARVPNHGVRPTSDPVREALFNLLGDRVRERPFFDLFAGTGAVGFEAFSRGARPVVLVEHDPRMVALIERNLERLAIGKGAPCVEIHWDDVASWLRRRACGDRVRDSPPVVFLDPPYVDRRLGRWLAALASSPLLVPDALVVIEHAARTSPRIGPERALESVWSRRYGDTSLSAWAVPGR